MRKIILKLIAVAIFSLLLSISGYVSYYFLFASNTHLMTYHDKTERLKSIDCPKAVFIGGSGTHFGLSAEEFEKQTGIKSVNMGLHASISMKTYLDLIETSLKDGDYLFIAPEYDYYCTPWVKTDSQNVEFALIYSNNIKGFELSSINAIPNTLYVGWSKWADNFKQMISLKMTGHSTEAYSRYDSNEYGDFVNYKTQYYLSSSYSVLKTIDQESIDNIVKRIRSFENRGVRVYLVFPPYADFAFAKNEDVIMNIYSILQAEDVNVLFAPNYSIATEENLYDTVYHVNKKGKQEYTQLVIDSFNSY